MADMKKAAEFYATSPTGQYDDLAEHALNNHNKLIKALDGLIEAEWMVTHDWGGDRIGILKYARKILKSAKGE